MQELFLQIYISVCIYIPLYQLSYLFKILFQSYVFINSFQI